MQRSHAGFSLVEMMVVVILVGVLGAFAYPSYVEHVQRGKRAECAAAMLQTANLLERYYTIHHQYDDDFARLNGKSFSGSNAQSSACTLKIEPEHEGETLLEGYKIIGTLQQSDSKCGDLTFTHLGEKGRTGQDAVEYCWR